MLDTTSSGHRKAVIFDRFRRLCPETALAMPVCEKDFLGNADSGEQVRGDQLEIKRSGSQPSRKGESDYFAGSVRIKSLFDAPSPARVFGASVTFEPGARTAWHTHPLGQSLIVTEGCGWAQRWGGPVEEIRTGDVVWFPPGEKHWHGATATTAMTHIAVVEKLDGKSADWMEQVTNEQYQAHQ